MPQDTTRVTAPPTDQTTAIGQVGYAAGRTLGGMCALRDAVRRTPVAMSLVMLGLGYLIGIVTQARPVPHR